jgi:malate synthase
MADFEDANAPTWRQPVIEGQHQPRDAVRRRIDFTDPDGKEYALAEKPAVLLVRPRGWHLPRSTSGRRRRADAGGSSTSASTSSTTRRSCSPGAPARISTCRSWRATSRRGSGTTSSSTPRSARHAAGTIKATVLIETILAAFEMDEILYELREHSAGLNCGRWDYIFSFIKKFRATPTSSCPTAPQVTMTSPSCARTRCW